MNQQKNIFFTLLIGSWCIYLTIFPYDELEQGSIVTWLLFFCAPLGLLSSVLAATHSSAWWKKLTVMLAIFLVILYALMWAGAMLEISSATSNWYRLQAIAKLKMGIGENLFSSGKILGGIVFAYWELMPFIQMTFLLCWRLMRSSAKDK